MEGFDGRRIKVCLDVPRKYSVPIVVPFGYSKDSEQNLQTTPRLPTSQVFFKNKYGEKFIKSKPESS